MTAARPPGIDQDTWDLAGRVSRLPREEQLILLDEFVRRHPDLKPETRGLIDRLYAVLRPAPTRSVM